MTRILAVLLLVAIPPAAARANAPPPDHFGPCEGKAAGEACHEEGCTCVVVDQGCPNGAATCLSCQRLDGSWCGPSSYGGPSSGPLGCDCSAAGSASALGLVGLLLLSRRKIARARAGPAIVR